MQSTIDFDVLYDLWSKNHSLGGGGGGGVVIN